MRTKISYEEARLLVWSWNWPPKPATEKLDYLSSLNDKAAQLPDGHLVRIVWDAEDGYPEHAWGYEQFTVRPYRLGYGCDGTTDGNIHLIAAVLCERVGIDYVDAYLTAYPDQSTFEHTRRWVDGIRADGRLAGETIVPPDASPEALGLMLSDLYQINNRSLVAELEERFTSAGVEYIEPEY